MVQVPLAEQDESEKALVLDGLNESLAAAIQIRRGNRQCICSHALGFQCGREVFGELRVTIMHHDGRLVLAIDRLIEELFGLFHHPSGVSDAWWTTTR